MNNEKSDSYPIFGQDETIGGEKWGEGDTLNYLEMCIRDRSTGRRTARANGCPAWCICRSATGLSRPVSYTHLDVYKRQAVYRGKSGQANLTVGSDDSGNIVAEASCDSLQQLVLWYEEELARIRSETKSEISNDVQTVEKRPPNRMRTFITGVLAGLLVGMLLTMKLKKR